MCFLLWLLPICELLQVTSPQKTVIVWGIPDMSTSYPMNVLTYDWQVCLEKCEASSACVMAYGNSSQTMCRLFTAGDFITVVNQESAPSADKDRVMFKLDRAPTECSSASKQMFGDENVFPTEPSRTYSVQVTPQYYTMKYAVGDSTDNCNYWLEGKPECDAACSKTMLSFYGQVTHSSDDFIYISSWRACLDYCWQLDECFMVAIHSIGACYKIMYGAATSFERTGDAYGALGMTVNFVAMKVEFDSNTCALDKDSALTSQTYTISTSAAYSSFTLETSGITSQITYTTKLTV
ncbi:unnamed protein product [Caenorhabditis sp. 36 PRJEB53466]|nr:unnamed protein product [Caenorhabditis sp. 36 PRJEB53466]